MIYGIEIFIFHHISISIAAICSDSSNLAGPVEGVSYASIKAGVAPDVGTDVPSAPIAATPLSAAPVPPPPVAPGDRKFTLQALGEIQIDTGADGSKMI